MIIENSKVRLLISITLITALIFTSLFISNQDGGVRAESISTAGEVDSEEQIDELTIPADPEAKYDGYIVKIEDKKTGKVDDDAVEKYHSTGDNEYVIVDSPEDTLDFIEPEYVEYIEPNYLRYAMTDNVYANALPSLNYSPYMMINVDSAWGKGYSGTGAKVGIFDSGLNTKNQGFTQENLAEKVSFINSYTSRTISQNINDVFGHGTFVTGLMAASSSAIKGISYDSTIDTYKVINDRGNGSIGDLLFGLEYLYLTGKTHDVINMSFGGKGFSQTEYECLKRLTDRGAIVVAAVGNEGTKDSPYNYPASYPNVIGVGSVDNSGVVSSFSSRNLSVLVVAPGENLVSLSRIGSSTTDISFNNGNSGTSYASPLVAGAAALLDQDGSPGITYRQFLTLIKYTSLDVNATGYDKYTGYGILNIGNMIQMAESGVVADSWQITYDPDGGTMSGSINMIHTYGTTTTLPGKKNMKKKGYTFSHWVDQNGKKRTSLGPAYTGDDLMLKAVWTGKKYKLKFKGNGGNVKSKTKTVKYGSSIGTLKSPKGRSGYNFLGWYTKKSGGAQYYKGKKYNKTGNQTLYAHWTKSSVVKFKANGGSVSKYAKKISKGKKYGKLPRPTRSGYKFLGWYTKKSGGTRIKKDNKVKSSGNVALYAHWKKVKK